MKTISLISKSIFMTAALFIPHILFADNSTPQDPLQQTPSSITMPEVLVEAEKITPTTGTFIIDKEMIESLPIRNGSVNEIVGIAPGIQFNEHAADSFTQGEITPPLISVSGSHFYDNNYTIDGISNNSPLDPASDSLINANKLPGNPQIHFLNPQIIENVTIYNSNIPAKFGGFIGGQIDTKTIDPDDEFWGRINYRTTRADWTEFHIDEQKEDKFYNSNSASEQPEFEKHEMGVTLNIPLSLDTGLVTSYQQLYSKIPLQHLGGTNNQSRRQENFFIKLVHYLPDNSKLSVTALSSPTSARYFLRNIKNSDYTLENDNNSLIVQYAKDVDPGQLNIRLGYTDQQSRRKAAKDRFFWDTEGASIDWELGREGSLGDLETGQKELSALADFTFKQFEIGQTEHLINMGIEATYSRQRYIRPETSYYYFNAVLDSSVVCESGDNACIDNEQYLRNRVVYNSTNVKNNVFDAAAYVQDIISWKRLELLPGLRFTYDDTTEENNIAPRLSAAVDLFDNGKTVLFAGLNRYYSGAIWTNSLYRTIATYNQVRSTSSNDQSAWSSTRNSFFGESSAQTPYTDEQTIGLIQRVLGGDLKIQYIKKSSKKEFAKERINNPYPEPDVYFHNNNGSSEHESLQASWQKGWKQQRLELNATWQKTNSSHSDYDSTFDDDALQETIWYEGEELYLREMPRVDFNRPFIINLSYSCRLPYDVTFTNITKYRGAYWRLWTTGERKPSVINPDQAIDPLILEKRKNKRTITFDWHLSWKIPSLVQQNIVLTFDILNVFNKKAKIAYQSGTSGYDYEIGRQLWAGVEVNF